jgi:hypothetical protein
MSTVAAARTGLTIPTIEASPEEIYDIELEHSLLEANAKLAEENRTWLDRRDGRDRFGENDAHRTPGQEAERQGRSRSF